MKRFFWVDLEMTGLDDTRDHILEVAAIITDLDFNPVEELHRVVYQPQAVLDLMDDWCRKTHGASGLTAAVATGLPLEEVQLDLVALLDRHFTKDERIVLVGNSVGNDRRFIDRYLPLVSSHLHYRLIDVSSFKEVFREKYGIKVEKTGNHRALDDIHDSINELKTYLSYVKVETP